MSSQPFGVVGIGDMSGDVFGNGDTAVRKIRMLGAFNHREIFSTPIPTPRPAGRSASACSMPPLLVVRLRRGADLERRRRLAAHGQVHRAVGRGEEALETEASQVTPNELIRALLRGPVDLLWNGASAPTSRPQRGRAAHAGDKANDNVRVNADGLLRVVGEGGNLGFTQPGRIEYSLAGGRINTDAIDNSAGVDCSDREVNIKILLNAVVAGDMTVKQRNELLEDMTESVADLVLKDNYEQSETSAWPRRSPSRCSRSTSASSGLEHSARLDRKLEALPSEDELAERARDHQGLTRPELSVLLAFSKVFLYAALLDSDVPEDPHLSAELARYFPPQLPERYSEVMRSHHGPGRSWRPRWSTTCCTAAAPRSRSGCTRRRALPRPRSRAPRGRSRGVRHAASVGGHRGPRQRGRSRGPAPYAARGPEADRARLALAAPQPPRPNGHPLDGGALHPRGRGPVPLGDQAARSR